MIPRTREGRYRVKVKDHGVIVADRTFVRWNDAEAWEADRKRMVAHGRMAPAAAGRTPVADVYATWSRVRPGQVQARTWQSDQSAWTSHLAPPVRPRPSWVDQQTRDVLFLAHDLHADHAAGTVRRIIATLIALLDFAKDLRWIEANPARVPPPLGRDPHGLPPHAILDPAELLAVWAVQRRYSPLADVTLFLGLTGLRWGEFVALRPGDLLTAATGGPIAHVARSIVRARGEGPPTVKSTKTGADRLVPLAHLTADIAQTWANGKDLLTNGPDILGVQGILGHASPTTTLRYYGHLTGTEHLRAPMDHYEAPLTAGGQAPGGALGATRPSMTTRTKTPIMENPL